MAHLPRANTKPRTPAITPGLAAPKSKGRLLCLHGWRSNNDVSEAQVRNLRLQSQFGVIEYLNAPIKELEAADPVTAEFTQGPYYSWVAKNVPPATAESQIKAALQHVIKHVSERGHYDCVYGFSTGGAIAVLLSTPEVLDKLNVERLWDSAIIGCGTGHYFSDYAEKALGVKLSGDTLSLPSLHLIGMEDRFKPDSERLMLQFDEDLRHVQYFGGGHTVPRELRSDAEFQLELAYWCAKQLPETRFSSRALRAGRSQATPNISKGALTSKSLTRQKTGFVDSGSMPATLQHTLLQLATCERKPAPGGGDLALFDEGRAVIVTEPPGLMEDFDLQMADFLAKAPPQAEFCRSHGRSPLTYGALLAFIQGDGDARLLGVTSPQDVVVYPAPQGAAAAVLMLAISSQACAAPLDPNATQHDVASALEQFSPQVLACFRDIAAQGFEAAAAEMKDGPAIAWCTADPDGPSGLYKPESPAVPGSGSQICRNPAAGNGMLLRTSGTTSKPKVVPLRAGALASNGAVLAASLQLRQDDCCLNAMPLFHIGGLSCSILATVAAGGSVTCMPKFDAQAFLGHLTEGGKPQPTWYSAVPTIHMAVLNLAASRDGGRAPSHKLRFIRTGAAALSQFDAIKLMEFWGVPVIPTYSMSEQMPICGSPMDVQRESLDGVGMPLCCSLALIYQDRTQPVKFGSPGEICICGPNVMSEYQDNPDANSKSFFYIGNRRFFRTGDVGTVDAEGVLRLVGRSKELIKRGGEQVSPPEVEGILDTHPDVKKAIVFAVPSATWGEEVGAALVLRDEAAARAVEGGKKAKDETITSVRSHALGSLALGSVPTHWRILQDSDLPKTSTGKYIRTGLAQVLGMEAQEILQPKPRAQAVSSSLSGLRWLMSVGVMFNHIASVTDEEYSNGPVFGEFKSSTFYFPATVFFILGGFSLSAGLSARPVTSLKKFYLSRMATLHPEYLFALLLALINFFAACPPGEYNDKFTFQREDADLACQSMAAVVPYGGSLVLSLLVFGLGLQAWPWFIPLTHWMLFYAWFSSVYYFIVGVFPMLHNALVRVRGNGARIWMWFGLAAALSYLTCVALACFYALPKWTKAASTDGAGSWSDNVQNAYALGTMLFPPYWVPCSLMGMAVYFLFDAYGPAHSHKSWMYGVLCDLLSAAFLAFHVGMVFDKNWPYPDIVNDSGGRLGEDNDSGINRYVWSVLVTRVMAPLIAIWIMLMAMPGKSYTARFFELPILAEILGPTAYGCFLYHQIVGQWYFWATRGVAWDWWSYRKSYYWFSPKPMPGAWYEFFYVVGLVTLFSMFVTAYIVPFLHLLLSWARVGFSRLTGSDGSQFSVDLSALELINMALEELLGGSPEATEEASIEELGLGSIGLPAFASALDSLDDRLHVAVADIATLQTIGELAAFIDEKRLDAARNAGVGTY